MAFDPRANAAHQTGFTFRGQPITLTKSVGRPLEGKWKEAIVERGVLPESKKLEIVAIYAMTGNMEKAAALAKVPVAHIKKWRRSEWFREYLREIQEENNEKLDAKYTEIIERSADLILDRLNNGDFHVNAKTGELVRKPVGIRDLAIVSAIKVDKRQLLRGLPTSRTESVNNGNKLEKLAEAFIQLANNTKKEPKLVEAEVIEITAVEEEKPVTLEAPTNELFNKG